MDKAALKAELVENLLRALEQARAAHASAVEGATHDEARPENDKDTRGLEQSYLARGQAQRVAELEAAVSDASALALRRCDRGGMGALVTIEDDGEERVYFIAPHGGGTVLAGSVQVVTPSSPLGRALAGKRVDDEIELELRGKKRTLTVASIS
jgi:transcription elongation GreA/GreB family factor